MALILITKPYGLISLGSSMGMSAIIADSWPPAYIATIAETATELIMTPIKIPREQAIIIAAMLIEREFIVSRIIISFGIPTVARSRMYPARKEKPKAIRIHTTTAMNFASKRLDLLTGLIKKRS